MSLLVLEVGYLTELLFLFQQLEHQPSGQTTPLAKQGLRPPAHAPSVTRHPCCAPVEEISASNFLVSLFGPQTMPVVGLLSPYARRQSAPFEVSSQNEVYEEAGSEEERAPCETSDTSPPVPTSAL